MGFKQEAGVCGCCLRGAAVTVQFLTLVEGFGSARVQWFEDFRTFSHEEPES